MKSNLLAAAAVSLIAAWPAGGAGAPSLKYVVIVSRHGVRSPTWETSRLNQYSSQPWPEWDVPPGNLTPHGRLLMQLMGAYYGEWLAGEHLLRRNGCADAARIYLHADKDQRTLETGRALAESLLPGCAIAVHSQPDGQSDPLFSGAGSASTGRLLAAVRERLGSHPQKLLADHRAALEALQAILQGNVEAAAMEVTAKGKSVELTGPLATGSTFSENLLLEYTNGLKGAALGWGRLTAENLYRAMEVHAVYADLMRRTRYLAQVRGSNLLSHVMQSLEQAASGKPVSGSLGQAGDAVLLLSGHDTNLSNLSGMLGLSWKLPGYQPDDTPPGGALIFALWRDSAGHDFLRLRYLAQSLDQMRNAVAGPPEGQDVPLPGCDAGCSWETARAILRKAIDPGFVN